MAHSCAHLSTGTNYRRRLAFFIAVILFPIFSEAQTVISNITVNSSAATSSTVNVTAPSDASNSITPSSPYDILYGQGNDIAVASYTVSSTTFDRFLRPDTLVLNRRLASDRLVNIWYTLNSINTATDPDQLLINPTPTEDADAIYQTGTLNAGYDNILVNDDDLAGGSIQVETERVDVIWYQGIQTSTPNNAVFPVIERGGNDNIAIAAITSLNADGTPASYGTLVGIPENFWPGTGQSFNNYLILRRETAGVEPIPLLNIGTLVGQSAQTVQGVAVSFTELGVSANQSIYGYSLFSADVCNGFVTDTNDILSTGSQTVKSGIDLTDISTFPSDTKSDDSGLDLVAGVSAAVASDDNLVETKGPGGYKAALATWLKANESDDVTTSTEGSNVTDWQDHWLGNHDFTTDGTAPIYRSSTSSINFNPTVDFTTTDRGLTTGNNSDFNTDVYEKKSINFALRTNTTDVTTRQVIYEQGGATRGLNFYIESGVLHVHAWNRQASDGSDSPWNDTDQTISTSISANTEYILTFELNGNSSKTGTFTAYLNGQSFGSISNVGQLYAHTGDITLGRSGGNNRFANGTDTNSNSFRGEISELIYCNEPGQILASQRNRIESYLAIKYGITLNQSTPINYFNSDGAIIFNTTQNASLGGFLEYNNDIAGIGRDDASELDQPASRSENTGSVVTIDRGATISTDDTWLIWGNDGGALTESSVLTMPDTIQNRLTRVWRVAEENEVLTTSVSFDLTGLGLSSNAADFSLLIAGNTTDANFSNATVLSGGTFNGNTITFTGVNLDDGEYFTLGTKFFRCSPGGVESNLALWLKADAGTNTTTEGGLVTSWEDQSENGNDATGAGTSPNYTANNINFNPAIEFDGIDEVLTSTSGFHSATYYLVINPDDNFTSASTYQVPLGFDDGTASPTNSIGGFAIGGIYGGVDDVLSHTVGNGTVGYGLRENNNSKTISSGIPLVFTVRENAGATAADIRQDGLVVSNSVSGSGYLSVSDEEYSLGRFETPNAFNFTGFYDGKIGELISYSTRPSDAENDRIESYLAIKYGITLDQTTGRDYVRGDGTTTWSATTNATYNNDIAGIGRDDLSCLEQKQSRSQNANSIVTMGLGGIEVSNNANTNSFADDGDFLIWGNDGDFADQANANTVDVPGVVTERMERIWKVQDTGNTGATTIQFDITGLGYSTNLSDFNLIVSNSSTMASGTIIPAASLEDGVLTFTNVDLTDGQFFTIGTARTDCGPGGVTTNLALWLKANEGTSTTTDGASITTWSDRAGANDAIGSGGTEPNYVENSLNYNPSVNFDQNNTEQMVGAAGFHTRAYYMVVNPDSTQNSSSTNEVLIGFDEPAGATNDFGGLILGSATSAFSDEVITHAIGGSGTRWRRGITQTTFGTVNANESYLMAVRDNAGGTSSEMHVNGRQLADLNSGTFLTSSDVDYELGSFVATNAFDVNGHYDGQIAEVISFSTRPTDAEHNRVQSYLSIKYGMTLNNTGGGTAGDYTRADGTIIWDASDYATYHNDVAGIGRDDDACFSQKQSTSVNSDDILAIGLQEITNTNAENSNSFDDSGDYLMWGNDNGATAQASAETSDVPNAIAERMTRVWRVNDTGEVGNTELQFDLTSLGYSGNEEDFSLLVSNSSTMADATVITGGTLNGNILSFSGIDLADGQFFTIGTAYKTCGPGGVNTNIALWLKGNAEAYSDAGFTLANDNDNILQWNDQSSPQINASLETLDGALPVEPTYQTNEINFNPVARFTDPNSSNASYLRTTSNSVTGNFTLFSVFKTGQSQGTDEDALNSPVLISSRNAGSADWSMGMQGGTIWLEADSDNGFEAQTTGTYNDNNVHFVSSVKNGTALNLYVDSESVGSGTGSATLGSATGFGIGNHFNEDLQAQFAGDIAETLVFSSALNSDERSRVESYMAIKYGLTRNGSDDGSTGSIDERDYRAGDGGVIWDYDGQGTTYYNDIFGIGRDDLSCLEQTTSRSENSDALVTFSLPGGFDTDDSFIVSGNDNAAIENPNNREFNSSQVKSRLNREWKVQETGTVGSIQVTFDLDDISGPLGVGTNNLSQLRLMVDNDGDFTSGTTLISPTSFNGTNNTVTFTVDFSNGQYYTLGSEEIAALPVQLISFTVNASESGTVQLRWATASEDNNSFFTVERSQDGQNFRAIGTINGAGNSEGVQTYQFADIDPFQGYSYYRLKQTDFNGGFEYTEIRSVFVNTTFNIDFTLYPNPVNIGTPVNIRYKVDQNKEVRIRIFDMKGTQLYQKEELLSLRGETITIPTSGLNRGLNLIKITDSQNKTFTLKLVVH